ncbi:hypothetical protein DSCOOX_43930 [Desulfosarcina ovata subsp. ovata]|uniref:Lipoprotein n=2 Tax=Desulfosarcina ovata TaxID=83564 RepID=A0A5K8AET7_9BACT|nr:hypothetical protein [Desulfosarcina ovata]BBO91213.1 hypothetical protein DSCOOX_43930 [Desulfosarcina ovata subsp. ovata]
MTTPSRTYHLPLLILLILVAMLTGCASVFQDLDDQIHRRQFRADHEAFDQILAIYDSGDVETALARFETLASTSASPRIARKARLGEICCRLILAETPAEYTAEIGHWQQFIDSMSETREALDPVLIDALVLRMIPKHLLQALMIPPSKASTTAPTSAESCMEIEKLKAELAVLKKKAEQTAELQRQLDDVMVENQSLKEKIKALEAIDQNIQKKKTEISAPSE